MKALSFWSSTNRANSAGSRGRRSARLLCRTAGSIFDCILLPVVSRRPVLKSRNSGHSDINWPLFSARKQQDWHGLILWRRGPRPSPAGRWRNEGFTINTARNWCFTRLQQRSFKAARPSFGTPGTSFSRSHGQTIRVPRYNERLLVARSLGIESDTLGSCWASANHFALVGRIWVYSGLRNSRRPALTTSKRNCPAPRAVTTSRPRSYGASVCS